MAQHNLTTVIGFEFLRTVRKPGFWIATLAVPVILAAIFALLFISNSSTNESAQARDKTKITFAYTDSSGIITQESARALGGTPATTAEQAIEDVRTGNLDAYFSYPADPATETIEITGKDRGVFDNSAYDSVAEALLTADAQQKIGDPGLFSAAAGSTNVNSTIYRDGEITGGFSEIIAPLSVLVVFFLVILMLSNQMLNATLEEKENRVTEMILTTVNPTTLVMGKIIALFAVGGLQILVFAAPTVIGYTFFRDKLSIPELDLSQLRLDPISMLIAVLLLIGGFVLFTGVLVAIGAVMPTAKDAGVVFGPLIFAMFVPFYATSLIVSDPESLIVQIFTYFPFTAPVTAMLLNGFGTLAPLTAAIVIAELFILGAIMLRVAVRLFRYGSIAYSDKLNLRATLSTKRPITTGP